MQYEPRGGTTSGLDVLVPALTVDEVPSLTGPWVFKLVGVA